MATALPVIFDAKTGTTPDTIVTTLCPRGFNPAITVDSGNYASDGAMSRSRFSAATTTGSRSTESSADRVPVETHRNPLGTLLPVTFPAPRIMSLHDPLWDAEKGSYQDNVKVSINF